MPRCKILSVGIKGAESRNFRSAVMGGFFARFLLLLLLAAVNPPVSRAFLFEGIRPLGMGNAFTAVADDEHAIFYNPAGLSYITGLTAGAVTPWFGMARHSADFIGDGIDTNLNDSDDIAHLIRRYTGKPQYAAAGVFPYMGFDISGTGMLFGVLANATMEIEIRNPVWTESHVMLNRDIAPLAGAGTKLPAAEWLRVGVALKYLHRTSLNETYTPGQITSNNFERIVADDLNSGTGFSFDIGALYDFPAHLLPFFDTLRFGVAGINIPEMSMGDATGIRHQVNLGMALEKHVKPWCRVIGALDFQDATYNAIDGNQLSRRVHMGMEIRFPYVSLRTGIHHGYLSAGGTIDLKYFKMDFATYALEKGAYAGQKPNRRYLARIFLGW